MLCLMLNWCLSGRITITSWPSHVFGTQTAPPFPDFTTGFTSCSLTLILLLIMYRLGIDWFIRLGVDCLRNNKRRDPDLNRDILAETGFRDPRSTRLCHPCKQTLFGNTKFAYANLVRHLSETD